jgi:predicted nucleic acid-binding protein
MRLLRVYVDTSVFGGAFDDEFRDHSLRFFDLAEKASLRILVSDVVIAELGGAPSSVRDILIRIPPSAIEVVGITPEVLALRDAYLQAGVLTRRWIDDATHVAAATVARADAIVSWNFRHIVRLDKIKAYNAVNLLNGFGVLSIQTPAEIRFDDSDED